MSSVTARINQIKQPRGGYIKPSMFTAKELDEEVASLYDEENVHSTIVGMAVDYLTRFMLGTNVNRAFSISLLGAERAYILGDKKAVKNADKLLKGISGLDAISIINACKLVTFDVWRRNPIAAMSAKDYKEINPDEKTIHNIQTMVRRSMMFWNKYGPITADGFTFEHNGYTETVDTGDGDYLTTDTMWDFKVSKDKPKNKHTLQLLMYWIMGQHSGKLEFNSISKLGIYNPRLNTVYTLEVSNIDKDIIREVEDKVICY